MNLTWECPCPNEAVYRTANGGSGHTIHITERCPMCGLSNTEVSEMLAHFRGEAS